MEIYKLHDEISLGRQERSRDDFRLRITDLKQGVKNPERVNVFVGGKYAFSLDIAQVVDYKLKVGREISEEELTELKKASEFGKLYQRTLEWALLRPRSEKETFDYLYKKIYEKKLDKTFSSQIIEKLKDKRYINDFEFAKWYAENRFVKKGVSKKRLEMELMKKGIARGVIEQVLAESGRDEKEEILKMISKKRSKYDDEKLMQYLCRQGFSYELVRNLVLESGKD